jgi:hypothetical protein
MLSTNSAGMPNWILMSGPHTEESAHDFVETSGILGRTLSVVRVSVWAEVTL